jgi:hypothetical protein
MPGVIVQTSTRSGPATPMRSPSGQFFCVGLAERGATDAPILMRDMADVEALLGTRQAYSAMYDQLKTFFAEGGLQAYAARVVGPAATKGTLSINDRDAAPSPTIKFDAASAGAWSANLTVEVLNGSAADSYRIVIRLDGDVVEDITNLKTVAEAVVKFKDSFYVKVSDLASDAVNEADRIPAVTAETALSAGADDRASVVDTHYIAAMEQFKRDLGDGCVAIPGQTGTTIWEAMIEHCEQNNRLAILAAASNESAGSLKSLAATVDSEFAGLFAPWVGISDGAGGQRFISPEGAVAGRRAVAHDQVGAWRAPAGLLGKMSSVISVQQMFTADEANELDVSKVSVIRTIKGGVRLYGWRSLSSNTADYGYLTNRDVLNTLVVQAEEALEDYVFAPVDRKGQLLSAINAELVGLVEPMRAAGGLYENIDPVSNELIDPGYKVETGSSVNTPQTLANNEVRARLFVRVSPTGGLVTLTIVKVGLLAGM